MKKMTKFMGMAALAVAVTVVTSCARRSELDKATERISKLENRVSALEKLAEAANTNIVNLQTVVNALANAEYVTFVMSTENGCTMTFRSGQTVTITNGKDGMDGKDGANGKNGVDGKNGADGKDGKDGTDGKDGKDGKDGSTPQISVSKAADGNWYWTVNGEWLTDASGVRVRANGEKGEQGQQGEPGANGVTPQLRINTITNEWEVSVDEGKTWTSLGVKATGENGSNGADGNSIFKSVNVDEDLITIVLADGTSLELPLFDSFKKVRDRVQSIVYVPEYADGMIAVEEGQDVTLTYSVMPAAMANVIADQKNFLSFVGKEVKTRAASVSLTVKDVTGDVEAGTLTVTATANDFVPGQYYAFALTFSDGTSAYQTPFTTVFSIVEAESISIGVTGLQAGMGVVEMGSYIQLYVAWNPVYATNKGVTWSSSNSSMAMVDDNGYVFVPADAADGTVTITATTANGKEASIILTIYNKKISVDTAQFATAEVE